MTTENEASKSKTPIPNQVDIALLTINESEDQAVRDAFGETFSEENRISGDRGIYAWGRVKTGNQTLVLVHASTGDAKGPLPAIELIRELDKRFRPQFLLVLGTAGGIKKRGIEYGQVVFSRHVHAGYQQLVDTDLPEDQVPTIELGLYDDPVQPPLDRLYFHAKSTAINWKSPPEMAKIIERAKADLTAIHDDIKQSKEAVGEDCKDTAKENWLQNIFSRLDQGDQHKPESTEFFSGSYLIDGKKSELYKRLLDTFPKVGAVEMEAGAVAQAMLHSLDGDRLQGYLIIKGISDVVDSEVPSAYRKRVRKALAGVASRGSAEFAKSFILRWNGSARQSIGKVSLLPPLYSSSIAAELGQKRNSNSIIYEDVSLRQFSSVLERLCDDGLDSVWTFSYLAPYRFFQVVEQADHSQFRGSRKLTDKDRSDLLLRTFPHFGVFIDKARKSPGSVVRIIHKGKNWEKENQKYLKAFAVVNGQAPNPVDCHVLDETDFEWDEWSLRSDHVVLNDELLLDFSFETKRLSITYLDPDQLGLRVAFLRFKNHCILKSVPENTYEAVLGKLIKTETPPRGNSRAKR